MSDDGEHGVVLIALLGNPMSPAYARARERAEARALDFTALNVALYGRGAQRWSLRERVLREEDRSRDSVSLGSSHVGWSGDVLVIDVDERSTPFGRPLRGRVVLRPEVRLDARFDLDPYGAHGWWPVAPLARIEVDLREPNLRFSGHGYHDANAGSAPLEAHFSHWSWARARLGARAAITYDVRSLQGAERSLALQIDRAGRIDRLHDLWRRPLRRSAWGLSREVRVDGGSAVRHLRSLEDGPFYARDLVEAKVAGRDACMMHETLSVDRLTRGWTRFLAGFRIGKAA